MSVRTENTGYTVPENDGEAWWFLDTLMIVKISGRTSRGVMTLIDCLCPAGFGPPPHIHHREDEVFCVTEGRITVFCDGNRREVGPGGTVFLPKGVQHHFVVDQGGSARMFQWTTPAGFDDFVADVGEPATSRVLPPPVPPDVSRLIEAAAKHGIEILVP